MGARGGDSLVDGQKDKGKRVTGIRQGLVWDEETNRRIKRTQPRSQEGSTEEH